MQNAYIGIDIGSTSTKTIVIDDNKKILYNDIRPTGWNGKDTACEIKKELDKKFFSYNMICFATGYGRVSVPFATKTLTEITCHSKGACELYNISDMNIIDIGGQDTKIIKVKDKNVCDFLMNDKCSAGTGRFLEVMSNILGVNVSQLFDLAKRGKGVSISSLCTVFAESEIISLIGKGESKENIAYAVINSIIDKVSSQAAKIIDKSFPTTVTGGLSGFDYIKYLLSNKLQTEIISNEKGKLAGALGSAVLAKEFDERNKNDLS